MASGFTGFSDQVARLVSELAVTDAAGSRWIANDGLSEATRILVETHVRRRKTFVIANGGSAAIAAHLQADLCIRGAGRVLTFQGSPLLTALSNDFGYECAFERMVRLWADPGDCLIAISSSGRSRNIINGAAAALDAQCNLITFSGFAPDNPLRRVGHVNFHVDSRDYGHVEVAHQLLVHAIADSVARAGVQEALAVNA